MLHVSLTKSTPRFPTLSPHGTVLSQGEVEGKVNKQRFVAHKGCYLPGKGYCEDAIHSTHFGFLFFQPKKVHFPP